MEFALARHEDQSTKRSRSSFEERLRALENENGKLMRKPADAMLDDVALKDLPEKKW